MSPRQASAEPGTRPSTTPVALNQVPWRSKLARRSARILTTGEAYAVENCVKPQAAQIPPSHAADRRRRSSPAGCEGSSSRRSSSDRPGSAGLCKMIRSAALTMANRASGDGSDPGGAACRSGAMSCAPLTARIRRSHATAALSAVRAHRGTEGSNPFPSTEESANFRSLSGGAAL
jgi:hypothetical protein